MKKEDFKKRFDMPDDIYNILFDGCTNSMSFIDIDKYLCNVTIDENLLPIVKEIPFDNNDRVKGHISRKGNDTENISDKIYNWFKKKFNI